MMNLSPDEMRVAVRVASYPNKWVEADNIERVDKALFEKVQSVEQYWVNEGAALIATAQNDLQAASAIVDQLREDVTTALADPTFSTDEASARFQALLGAAEACKASLGVADRSAVFVASRAEDPYAHYTEMLAKNHTLRPAIDITIIPQ